MPIIIAKMLMNWINNYIQLNSALVIIGMLILATIIGKVVNTLKN